MTKSIREKILIWYITGERGFSSETMARAVSEIGAKGGCHPLDPGDFNRCVKFLEAVPEARQHMHKIAKLSPIWDKLVSNWEELENTLKEELPTGKAPRLYKRMKELGC